MKTPCYACQRPMSVQEDIFGDGMCKVCLKAIDDAYSDIHVLTNLDNIQDDYNE